MPPHLCWQRSNVTFSKNKKWKVYKFGTQTLQQRAITPSCLTRLLATQALVFLEAHVKDSTLSTF